jgi:hypothetical protein
MRRDFGFGFGSPHGVWSPSKIGSSLVEWLAPDSMVVATGHVTSWADKSGSGVTVAEATNPPAIGAGHINGYAFAAFDTNMVLGAAAQLFTTSYTIAAVLRPRAAGGGPMLTDGNGTTGVELLESANRIVQHNNIADLSDGALVQSWELWVARCTTAPLTTLQVNGTDKPLSPNSSPFTAPAAGSKFTLGGRWNGASYTVFANVDIAEVLICNAALDDTTTTKLTSYLRGKYGL